MLALTCSLKLRLAVSTSRLPNGFLVMATSVHLVTSRADHAGIGDDASIVSELSGQHGPRTIISKEQSGSTHTAEVGVPVEGPTIQLASGGFTIKIQIATTGASVIIEDSGGNQAQLAIAGNGLCSLKLASGTDSGKAELKSDGTIELVSPSGTSNSQTLDVVTDISQDHQGNVSKTTKRLTFVGGILTSVV